jgi:hypothetical protein
MRACSKILISDAHFLACACSIAGWWFVSRAAAQVSQSATVPELQPSARLRPSALSARRAYSVLPRCAGAVSAGARPSGVSVGERSASARV